jgi:hypothetical protein
MVTAATPPPPLLLLAGDRAVLPDADHEWVGELAHMIHCKHET